MSTDSILTAYFSKPQFVATMEGLQGTDTQAVLWKGMAVVSVDIDSGAAVTDMPMASDQPNDSETTQAVDTQDLQAIKIIQPVRMTVVSVIEDISTLENIIQTFRDKTVTISVNSKSIITDNLILTGINVDQTPDMITASKVTLTFEQALPPNITGYAPAQAGDASVYGVNSINNPSSVPMFGSLGNTIQLALGRIPVYIIGPLLDDTGGPFILNQSRLS